jgi:hypothetical protein
MNQPAEEITKKLLPTIEDFTILEFADSCSTCMVSPKPPKPPVG